jgi:dipeptidyl aminopeptidase/acylaminoacyl peptidase
MQTLALVVSIAVAAPSPSTPASAAPPPAKATAPGKYTGLGAESVDPATMAKFRAPPLDPAVRAKVQALLDVRAAGPGLLSPDGKRLFFSWAVTGVRHVWRLDRAMGFPVQMTGGDDRTDAVDITDDGKWLVVQRDRAGEENPGLYLQNADGGPLVPIQHKAKVQTFFERMTPDGRGLYFRANDERPDAYTIYRYDFAAKTIAKAFDGAGTPALWRLTDARATKTGDVLLLAKDVGSNMQEVYEYDTATKALTALVGVGEREEHEARYGAGDTVLVLSPKVGEFRRLYRVDRANKNAMVAVSPEMKWDIDSYDVDEKRARITCAVNEAGFTRARVFDAKTFKEIALPKLPNGDHVVFGATTRDGRFTTITVDPGTAPAQSFALEWRTKKLVQWHVPSAPEVDLASFVGVALESYTARDGVQVPMFVRRPKACLEAKTPCPVIIDFHGGPEAQARAGFSTRAQLFVDAGFVYVQPNVRGSDGYGRTWIHADDGAKRKNVVTDIEDAAIFVKKAWAKDGKAPKVGIFGGSYGGYSALMGMTYFAGAYDAGVAVVGISSLVTFLENTAPYRRALRVSEYGDPEKDRAVLLELSPITHVNKAKGPLFIFQGATDPRVPVGEAVQMHAALEKNGANPKMVIFPDEGHGVQKRDNNVLLLGHSLAFFNEKLR